VTAPAPGTPAGTPFPRLVLRQPAGGLLDLPWELELAAWPDDVAPFRELAVGPSRHLVRFLGDQEVSYALKELPLIVARTEFDVLRHLERLGLAAVRPIGLAEAPARGTAILVTEYLRYSIQYRRLLMRFPPGPGAHRDRLLDAMAWLLVDLHRAGVYWGDCSLANTLFRRDGDKIQAYLVDAETGEVHPQLSNGQRAHDLEILVENVAFGLADLAALQGISDDPDDAIEAAEDVRRRYEAVWAELHDEPAVAPGDRFAIRSRIRRLNELGFGVDEVELVPSDGGSRMRIRAVVSNRRFHANELERMTGLRVLEGQARILLNDLREHVAWLEYQAGRSLDEAEGAAHWRSDVLEPTLARLTPIVGSGGDVVQAYCDLLEEKWLLSEAAGRDVGLEATLAVHLDPPPSAVGGDVAPEAEAAPGGEPGVDAT
jgi:hypothetical protein